MDVNDGKEKYDSEDFAFMRKTASGEDNDNIEERGGCLQGKGWQGGSSRKQRRHRPHRGRATQC